MKYITFVSPLGKITLCANKTAITGLHLEGDRYFSTVPEEWKHDDSDALLQRAKREVLEYLGGKKRHFTLPLAIKGTSFQEQVWKAIQKIPYGTTTSYSAIAKKIGRPKAVRAVGTAVGRNPMCLIIPCHRVVASGGGFGGYVAGIACKQQLLQLENNATIEVKGKEA